MLLFYHISTVFFIHFISLITVSTAKNFGKSDTYRYLKQSLKLSTSHVPKHSMQKQKHLCSFKLMYLGCLKKSSGIPASCSQECSEFIFNGQATQTTYC